MAILFKREYCWTEFGERYCRSDAWDDWVRWLVLALIIVAALFFFFLFSCITARRRRQMGYAPYRGTGWTLGRTPAGHAPATYNSPPYQGAGADQQPPYYANNTAAAPPAYTHGAANDYYAPQQRDVELQQPQPTYGGEGFAPPAGPPPRKA